jgi:RNA polymerase sigma-70 factor (ECF subfamily)
MTALEFSYSINKVSKSLKPFAMRLTKDSEMPTTCCRKRY